MQDEVGTITIEEYNSEWPRMFRGIASRIRNAMGPTAVRIDHIGSTSVPGLAAKPIIDIQISVASFEPMDTYRRPLEELGFEYRDKNPELTKRYFKEPRGVAELTHIHVRRAGSFSEQLNLLFRDYMRCHAAEALAYAELKCRLAQEYIGDRPGYTEAKDAFIWNIIRRADRWAADTGWHPEPSDA
ncbi:MAG: GrpB family protein [Dehalococcoidia bacterium]